MRMSFEMTLDGLKRALRWKVHDLAESVEYGYRAAGQPGATRPVRPGDLRQQAGEADNDRRRR